MFVNGTGGQCVIADYAVIFERHVRSGRVCLLIRPRELLQPQIETRIATIEVAPVVVTDQFVDDELGYASAAHARRSAMCGSLNRRCSRGLSFGGRARTAMKALHCFSSTTKRVWSASTCSAFSRALRMMNSVRLTPCRSAATLMSVSSEAVARSWKRRSRGCSGVDRAISSFCYYCTANVLRQIRDATTQGKPSSRIDATTAAALTYATPHASLRYPDQPEARHCGAGPLGGVPGDRALRRDLRGAPTRS